MSYGLFDGDIDIYPYIPFFNLELMKIARYYKNKREIVILSPSFSPQMYQHFILRQDLSLTNRPVSKYSNIEYGGYYFNPNVYVPLPEEIEICPADTSIYTKIEKNYQTSQTKTAAFRRMKKAEHIRLSLDGKKLWNNFEKQLKYTNPHVGLVLHDYNLNDIPNAAEAIKYILKNFSTFQEGGRIGMKFPVQVNNEQELFEWMTFRPMRHFYSIQYNGIMDDEVLEDLVKYTQGTSKMVQMYYNITKNLTYEFLTTEGVIKLYHQICFLRTKGVVFSLIYDEDFFLDKRWLKVIKLMQQFWNSIFNLKKQDYERKLPYDSMYSFVTTFRDFHRSKNDLLVQDARDAFQFIRLENYDLFKDFYEYRVKMR